MPGNETKRRKCSQCPSNRGHTKLCVQRRREPTPVRRIFIIFIPLSRNFPDLPLEITIKCQSLWLNILGSRSVSGS